MLASVIVVDPEITHAAPTQAALQSMGCTVYSMRDIHEASKWCPRLQPDLVLLATSALTEDARQIIQGLKAAPRTRLTPIVACGTEAQFRSAAHGQALPLDETLPEPAWNPAGLERIQAILALKRFVDSQTESALISAAISLEDHFLSGRAGHCQRVSYYAVRLGRRIGMTKSQLEALQLGAVLHDIGKLSVPTAILDKPGPLNATEFATIRRHPIAGEEICSALKSLRRVLPIIRHHHERMDGSGYPDGLKGEEIPLASRVLQVADIYDALTSERPYRKALSRVEALRIMRQEAEQGWRDENLVDTFETLNLATEPREEKSKITSGSQVKSEEQPGFLFGSCPEFVLYPSGWSS